MILSTISGPTGSAATLQTNRPPDAQAGPAYIVIDGGADDEDGADDGVVSVRLDGTRTTDPDRDTENDITCSADSVLADFSDDETTYRWYKGHGIDTDEEDPIATGESPKLYQQSLGMHNFTLEAEDKCEETDTDIVRAMFVNDTHVNEKKWTFENGTPANLTTDGLWRVTDECGTSSDGQYLAFNRPGDCNYDTEEPLQGNATFTYDLGEWFTVGLEFETRWDIREEYVEEIQDNITAQASLDHERSWTQANLTFDYSQGEYDENSTWVRGAGVFDLRNSTYRSGDVSFRLSFDTGSSVDADNLGWLVDNVRLIGLQDSQYQAEWGNGTITQSADLVERSGLDDADGDGVAEIDSPDLGWESGASDLQNTTNQDIIDTMDAMNLTDADIKEEINESLRFNSSADDEKEEAFEQIDNDGYIEASDTLINSEAQVTYYCDTPRSSAPNHVNFPVGYWVTIDCDNDRDNDIRLRTQVTWVESCDSGLDNINLYIQKRGIEENTDEEVLWGVRYQGVGGFADGDGQYNDVTADVSLNGLCGNVVSGTIDVKTDLEMDSGDRFGLFSAHQRDKDEGKTLEAELEESVSYFDLNFAVTNKDAEKELKFTIPDKDRQYDIKQVFFDFDLERERNIKGVYCQDEDADNDQKCGD